jgi:DsbC/DsbD-like thiol-disulfide interchange protein
MNAACAKRACHVAIATCLSFAGATQELGASKAQSPWGAGILAQARIVLAQEGLSAAGTIQGAIEIALPPGSATYWVFPGPNGLTPSIVTTGSVNLGRFDLGWPAPRPLAAARMPEHQSAGYRDGVMLPFDAQAADPTRPVALMLEIEIGVCDDLCVPDFLVLDLVMSPGAGARSVHADRIAGARAAVPVPDATAGLRVIAIARPSPASPLTVQAHATRDFGSPVLFVESLSPDCRTVVAPRAVRGGEAEFHVAAACARDGALAVVLSDGGTAVRAELPLPE